MRRTGLFCVLGIYLASPAGFAGEVSFSADLVGPYTLRVTSLKEARHLKTIRQQFDFSCGSAAVATLLSHHYGHPVDEQTVFQAMFAAGDQNKIKRQGFSLLDMKNYLEGHGFKADGFEASLDALTKAKIPAIALISEKGYNHFVVIKGLRDGRVLFGDPAAGTRALSRAAFEAIWQQRILFVIRNREERAQFNREVDWRVVPRAPLEAGIRDVTDLVSLMRGAGDF